MRLAHAEVKNFKLLEDVSVDFSLNADKPLTVIRAENGSGKTSLLYALLWAFYGMRGLPEHARELRLTSTACPPDMPVQVQVMVEFHHTDENGLATKYRLIRSVAETPTNTDSVQRTPDRLRLLRITTNGEEDVVAAEALIEKLVPLRLRDVFFTNGDDVQTFISGRVSTQQRQAQVHHALRALLGLDSLRTAAEDVDAAYAKFRREAAKSAGADVEQAELELEQTDKEINSLKDECAVLQEQLKNMIDQREQWSKELNGLRGLGDIDELNARISALEKDASTLEAQRLGTLTRMHDEFRSEELSWFLLGDHLEQGFKRLGELADRRVIPGASIEVLTDRLELHTCICGTPLEEGSAHRCAVEELRDEQQKVSDNRQRLTALFHQARQLKSGHDARAVENRGFETRRRILLADYTGCMDQLRAKGLGLEQAKQRRSQIDEERVRDLTQKIGVVEKRIGDSQTKIGHKSGSLLSLEETRKGQADRLRVVEKAAQVNKTLLIKRDVADDLLALARGTLAVLETDYLEKVSDRMKNLFMQIVGSDPGFEAGVFTGVHISGDFDIIVDSRLDRTLDTDFELNGASQRALTLAFIWSLMEVSGTTAPRIIDTPLGMVAGGVKTRMVDTITRPAGEGMPDFQVILLLTRSEVRDIEGLLDERAGTVHTLSCAKDYPMDLLYNWGVDRPLVRICSCTHRQSCRVCARRYDDQHGISFRDLEESACPR